MKFLITTVLVILYHCTCSRGEETAAEVEAAIEHAEEDIHKAIEEIEIKVDKADHSVGEKLKVEEEKDWIAEKAVLEEVKKDLHDGKLTKDGVMKQEAKLQALLNTAQGEATKITVGLPVAVKASVESGFQQIKGPSGLLNTLFGRVRRFLRF